MKRYRESSTPYLEECEHGRLVLYDDAMKAIDEARAEAFDQAIVEITAAIRNRRMSRP